MTHPTNRDERLRIGKTKARRRVTYLWVSDIWTKDERERYILEWEKHYRTKTKACSCYMCGNPRKHFNEKSMQERKREEHDRGEIPVTVLKQGVSD